MIVLAREIFSFAFMTTEFLGQSSALMRIRSLVVRSLFFCRAVVAVSHFLQFTDEIFKLVRYLEEGALQVLVRVEVFVF